MLYRFQSQATGDVVMLPAHAEALLHIIGKDAAPQGVLTVEDMPAALAALQRAIAEEEARRAHAAGAAASADEEADDIDPQAEEERPGMRQRAWPLMQMIERAAAEGQAVVWGV
jgi:hypothetical protein